MICRLVKTCTYLTVTLKIAASYLRGLRPEPNQDAPTAPRSSPNPCGDLAIALHGWRIFTSMRNEQTRCPFFRPAAAVCGASPTSRIPPAAVRKRCCAGEDPEGCPTFLTRLLNAIGRRGAGRRPLARA